MSKPIAEVLANGATFGYAIGNRPYSGHRGFSVYRIQHLGHGQTKVDVVGSVLLDEQGGLASFAPNPSASFFDVTQFQRAAGV